MSYGTTLMCEIYFSRKTYDKRYKAEEDLEEVRGRIQDARERLLELAVCTEPSKLLCCEDCEGEKIHPLDIIEQEFKQAYDFLLEALEEQWALVFLLDNWDYCHDNGGHAIHPPKELRHSAYISGDFIYSKAEAAKMRKEDGDECGSEAED